jgi:hypothetical protein
MFVLTQMNLNILANILGRSSIKIAHFVPIRKQIWPSQAILVSDWSISKKYCPLKPHSENEKWFQRRTFFRNRPIRNKNCLWRTCLLSNGDEMKTLYRGPFKHAYYQVLVHLAKRFQRRRYFRNRRSISKKYCPLQPHSENEPTYGGNILGMSSIKNAHFVPIR